MPEKLSVIVPVYNEADQIHDCLKHLQLLRKNGHEVLVVDGGSQDRTRELSLHYSDRLIQHAKGRARQMNVGASFARGDIFLFLHADTRLPEVAEQVILQAIEQSRGWGYFPVKLSGQHWFFRIIETMMNIRTRMTGIITGDHAIFMSRELYEKVGGFGKLELMEDIAISKKLRHHDKPICLSAKVLTSSRRWEQNGIIRTILKMWHLRLAYFFGAKTLTLARHYD